MNEITKNKIEGLLALLNEQQKEYDNFLEITKSENPEIYEYLDNVGTLDFKYSLEYESQKSRPPLQESKGFLTLWEKQSEKWIIYPYNIEKRLNLTNKQK